MKKIENYKIEITPKAYKQISVHISFVKKVSVNSANELRKTFKKDILSLQKMPQRYNFFNVDIIPPKKYRKMISSKRYIILYQIIEDTVFIDNVIDTRQNLEWLIF